MFRRILPIVSAAGVLLTSAISATPLPQAGLKSQVSSLKAQASLDEKLSAAVTRGDVPGVVAVAATRDRILYQGAFGNADVAAGRSMTADALFRIASMTLSLIHI